MRFRTIALAAALAVTSPVAAQGFMSEMHRDLNQVQEKFMALANAMPESAYGWRPGAGVRSVGEVFLHVGSDNYLLPIMMGAPAPAATGITADFATAVAYEKRTLSKAQIIAELQASFVHLHQAINRTTDANLGENVNMFGQQWSRQRAMLLTVTHLHEHLGQAIAYARSNNVKPPWSN